MSTYDYPVIRFGSVYSIGPALDVAKATAVANRIQEKSLPIQFADDLSDWLASEGWTLSEPLRATGDAPKEAYEGYVAALPHVVGEIESSLGRLEIQIAIVNIVCLPPRHSKIWTMLALSRIDGESVESVSRSVVEDFQHWSTGFARSLREFTELRYASAIHEGIGEDARIELISEVSAMTVGSRDESFRRVADDVVKERPVRLSDELDRAASSSLSDFLFLSVGQDIHDASAYLAFVEKRRREWRRALANDTDLGERYDEEVAEQGGLQMFGLVCSEAVALFSRLESLQDSTCQKYFGMATRLPDSDVVSDNGASTALRRPSLTASGALMDTLSPLL